MNQEVIEVFKKFKDSSINFAEIILKYDLDKEDKFWEDYPFNEDFLGVVNNIIDWYNTVLNKEEKEE